MLGSDSRGPPSPAAERWSSWQRQQDTLILGSFLLMLAAVAFLWFAGALRAVLRRKEGGEGRLGAIAFGNVSLYPAAMGTAVLVRERDA